MMRHVLLSIVKCLQQCPVWETYSGEGQGLLLVDIRRSLKTSERILRIINARAQKTVYFQLQRNLLLQI